MNTVFSSNSLLSTLLHSSSYFFFLQPIYFPSDEHEFNVHLPFSLHRHRDRVLHLPERDLISRPCGGSCSTLTPGGRYWEKEVDREGAGSNLGADKLSDFRANGEF